MEDTTMPPSACTCDCKECMEDKNCAMCSHMDSPEGCDCDGCTCAMDKPMEPPMAA